MRLWEGGKTTGRVAVSRWKVQRELELVSEGECVSRRRGPHSGHAKKLRVHMKAQGNDAVVR